MDSVYGNEDDPGEETDDPWVPGGPELKDKLGSGEIGRDRDGVVEPIVPRQCESVRGGEEAGSVCVKRAWGYERA